MINELIESIQQYMEENNGRVHKFDLHQQNGMVDIEALEEACDSISDEIILEMFEEVAPQFMDMVDEIKGVAGHPNKEFTADELKDLFFKFLESIQESEEEVANV